jgi:hypothetical protein
MGERALRRRSADQRVPVSGEVKTDGAARMAAPQPLEWATPASRQWAPAASAWQPDMHAPPGARSFSGEPAHATNSRASVVIRRSVPACPARMSARAAAMDICVSSVKVPGG